MSCGGDITKIMTEFLQSMPEGKKNYSDEEIGELFGVYARLLGHLEAFFSILRKKRFHSYDSEVDKEMRHRDAIEILWRYLKMSVTPKLHLLFVHLLIFLERVGTVVNLAKKERTKSQFEAMKKSAKVKEMMSDLKKK